MRVLSKWLVFSFLIGSYFATSALAVFVPQGTVHSFRTRVTRWYSQRFLHLMGIRVQCHGEKFATNAPLLIVANHLSYLDILIVFSSYPCRFITSVEVRDTPFLGWLCRSAGCLFVERRDPRGVRREVELIATSLQGEEALVLFPEGTSGNGDRVLPFKTSFLECAIKAKATVAPVCLVYHSIDGNPVDASNRDGVYWYGDMDFFPHLKRVLRHRQVEVGLYFLKPLAVGAQTRRELGEESYALIEQTFRRHSKATV